VSSQIATSPRYIPGLVTPARRFRFKTRMVRDPNVSGLQSFYVGRLELQPDHQPQELGVPQRDRIADGVAVRAAESARATAPHKHNDTLGRPACATMLSRLPAGNLKSAPTRGKAMPYRRCHIGFVTRAKRTLPAFCDRFHACDRERRQHELRATHARAPGL
jgi:hypothetical protein